MVMQKVLFSNFISNLLSGSLRGSLSLLVLILTPALAQADAGAQAQPPGWVQMVPLVILVAIFYLLILRPQQKREKLRQSFVSQLKRGDDVILSSGILGRIEGMNDQVVTLEIADGVRMKVLRSAITSSVQAMQKAAAANKAKSDAKGENA